MENEGSIRGMQECIRILREELTGLETLQQLDILLYIGENPGASISDMEEKLNIKYGTVSRTLRAFAIYMVEEEGKDVLKGFDLIEGRPNLYERKRKDFFLTKKGERLFQQMKDALR